MLPEASSLADDLAALGIASVEEAGSNSVGDGTAGAAADDSVALLQPRAAWLQAALALTPESASAWQHLADWYEGNKLQICKLSIPLTTC